MVKSCDGRFDSEINYKKISVKKIWNIEMCYNIQICGNSELFMGPIVALKFLSWVLFGLIESI